MKRKKKSVNQSSTHRPIADVKQGEEKNISGALESNVISVFFEIDVGLVLKVTKYFNRIVK